jgi:hypothetical protein
VRGRSTESDDAGLQEDGGDLAQGRRAVSGQRHS